jgi:hypothetical protein
MVGLIDQFAGRYFDQNFDAAASLIVLPSGYFTARGDASPWSYVEQYLFRVKQARRRAR